MNRKSPWEILQLMLAANGAGAQSGFAWYGQLFSAAKPLQGGEKMDNQTVPLSQIKEVWESVSGWYWFVTEYHEGSLVFGLVRGWETEWGYFDLDELRRLAEDGWLWQVPKENWAICPCVVQDAVSHSQLKAYAKGQKLPKQPRSLNSAVRGAVPRRAAQTQGGERSRQTKRSFAGLRSLNKTQEARR